MTNIKIADITSVESDMVGLIQGFRDARKELKLKGTIELRAASTSDLNNETALEEFMSFARSANVIIIHLMGGKKSFPEYDQVISSLKALGIKIHAQATASENDIELLKDSTLTSKDYNTLLKYIDYGGVGNFKNLLLYIYRMFSREEIEVEKPLRPPFEGIYHPALGHVNSLESYLQRRYDSGKITIGLWFYQSYWATGNLEFIDVLIEEIEKRGMNVIPVFFYTVKDEDLGTLGPGGVIKKYFFKDGKLLIDTLISTVMFSLTQGTGGKRIFEELGVPVIKAIVTLNKKDEWETSSSALNPMDVAVNLAMPEFDGVIISVPVAAKKFLDRDHLTGARILRHEPIKERIQKLVSLAKNWARLKKIPDKNKKVAIIFHNYPPRNDRIGSAFLLDAPQSVVKLLEALKKRDYTIGDLPEDGDALIKEILKSATNDRRWASMDDIARTAVDLIKEEDYTPWFQEEVFPEDVKEAMEKAWGPPPGDIFNHQGALIVPGIITGNIFIGIQPPRGFLDDPAKIYHSPDSPPPYHYLAYYRWIRNIFEADAVLHIGKHGSLEWLPGKSAGLSRSCYPDLAIQDLPNIYPYIINDPGEGTQAKRRSYAVIIDHLIPIMVSAGTYEGLEELELLLGDYYHATGADPQKIEYLKNMIWEKVEETNIHDDLEILEKEAFADFGVFLEKLHGYLNEIKTSRIREGLHILGRVPAGEDLVNLLVSLTQLPNGDIPSLRAKVAEAQGLELNTLLDNPGTYSVKEGKTYGEIIYDIDETCTVLLRHFMENSFEAGRIKEVITKTLGRDNNEIRSVLSYISRELVQKLEGTKGEIENVLEALEGKFVLPGPSGAPTRGMADILPTGRNFFSVDPQAIPSPAAWRVGKVLAESLLERYYHDEGKYPESIGMVIWGTGIMRTKGDDIAEVLYLLGVRPRWEKRTGRVIGLEIIPVEELGRPRVDVTLRISGLLRDAFPNIVDLLDDAIELVSSLDEEKGQNYLAEHVKVEFEENLLKGMKKDDARRSASYRIFSCRPGTYGAGISDVIDSKNWKDEKDLAEIYVTWGGYAYGRNAKGEAVFAEFKKRLTGLQVTVKNEDNTEYDIFDSDDFYSYHGGMIAAVRGLKGSAPKSYKGDSSNPERVKTRSTREEARFIFRNRILNPKWIASMKKHGYKGAGDLSRTIDTAFGWDATAELLEDWMYEELARKYALDKKMQQWLRDVNPYALYNITERLQEAIERGMWDAPEDINEELRRIHLEVEGDIEAGGEK